MVFFVPVPGVRLEGPEGPRRTRSSSSSARSPLLGRFIGLWCPLRREGTTRGAGSGDAWNGGGIRGGCVFDLVGDAVVVVPKCPVPTSLGRRAAVPCSRSATHAAMVFFGDRALFITTPRGVAGAPGHRVCGSGEGSARAASSTPWVPTQISESRTPRKTPTVSNGRFSGVFFREGTRRSSVASVPRTRGGRAGSDGAGSRGRAPASRDGRRCRPRHSARASSRRSAWSFGESFGWRRTSSTKTTT